MNQQTFKRLMDKYALAKLKHDWSNYNADDKNRALTGELMELAEAQALNDSGGEHGIFEEALDVAVVALRIAEGECHAAS